MKNIFWMSPYSKSLNIVFIMVLQYCDFFQHQYVDGIMAFDDIGFSNANIRLHKK